MGTELITFFLYTVLATLLAIIRIEGSIKQQNFCVKIVLFFKLIFVWNLVYGTFIANIQNLFLFSLISFTWPAVSSSIGILNFTITLAATITTVFGIIIICNKISELRKILQINNQNNKKRSSPPLKVVSNISIRKVPKKKREKIKIQKKPMESIEEENFDKYSEDNISERKGVKSDASKDSPTIKELDIVIINELFYSL